MDDRTKNRSAHNPLLSSSAGSGVCGRRGPELVLRLRQVGGRHLEDNGDCAWEGSSMNDRPVNGAYRIWRANRNLQRVEENQRNGMQLSMTRARCVGLASL